jgi:hypothetical protein
MASIYRKNCPSCSAVNLSEAERCSSCGWSFLDPATLAAEQQALEQAQLLEDYLCARVDQSLAVVESARAELAREPASFERAARVLRAVQEAAERRRELDAQKAQTREIRDTLSGLQGQGGGAPGESAMSAQPGAAFHAQQAARASAAMAKFEGTDTRSCPKCRLTLPVSTAMCLCGFAFDRGENALPHPFDRPLAGDTRAERKPS